jgi:hypothetical protein
MTTSNWAGGHLSDRARQREYVRKLYEGGMPCWNCGKVQTPWQAAGKTVDEWFDTPMRDHAYACVECASPLRHDVYLTGGWGWGNPTLNVHR